MCIWVHLGLIASALQVLGVIDQPVLQERWLGIQGRATTLNGVEIQTRATASLKDSYLYAPCPFKIRIVALFII